MTNRPITLRTIDAIKPSPTGDVYTWDTNLKGFGVRITPKGVKSYVLQYRVNGGPARRKTIGLHGSPWTTQTARREAERLLTVVRQGVDPQRKGAQFLGLLRLVCRTLPPAALARHMARSDAHA
jgi:hypothetical protein